MENNGIKRTLGMLGLAMRAGKLTLGTDMICRALQKGASRLVLISDTASAPTKKKLTTKCEFYGVSCMEISVDMDELGRVLGKTYAPAAVSVNDTGFAEQIVRLIGEARANDSDSAVPEQIFRKEVSDVGNGD